MLDEGMLAAGDHVVDPFGGVGLGALDAMRHGLHWHGCELEPRFHELGNQNIGLWNGRYRGWFDLWGTAVLHCGDSRQLAQVIGAADGCVSSPPFQDQHPSHDKADNYQGFMHVGTIKNGAVENYGTTPGQLGSMKAGDYDAAVSSPPFSPPGNQASAGRQFVRKDYDKSKWADSPETDYGGSRGQLGAMLMNDYDAAISSPPYADTIENGDGPGARWDEAGHPGNPDKVSSQASYGATEGQLGGMDGCISSPPYGDAVKTGEGPGAAGNEPQRLRQAAGAEGENAWRNEGKYGTSAGQLAQMDGAVSSPPFESSIPRGREPGEKLIFGNARYGHKDNTTEAYTDYGTTPNNIGNDTGESFWLAARDIVAQVYNVLKPGGVAAWVCGDFVRDKQRVYFGRQWLALCESVGFEPLAWAIAWKTEYNGNQLDIFGGDVEKRTDRVSFFRRLANEKNPDAAILNEDVIFVRKPL
jgi:hypothetical protein